MKTTRRIFCAVLAVIVLLSFSTTAFAKRNSDGIVSMGSNLSDAQRAEIYDFFGIEEGSVPEIKVTIEEERALLSGKVPDERIGSRSLSCVYITETKKGGINVETHNIDWCTKEMYASAMATAGIENANVIVAAPFNVSGTAALVGIYKAYEELTGEELDEGAKDAAAEELVLTGELSEYLDDDEAIALINELKGYLDTIKGMTDGEVKELIQQVADKLGIDISGIDLDRVVSFLRYLSNLDIDVEALLGRIKSLKATIDKLKGTEEKAESFFGKIGGFFNKVGGFFGKLFGKKD